MLNETAKHLNTTITAHGLGSMQNTSLKNSQNVTREHWCPPGWLRQPSRPQLFIHSNLSPMTRATRHSMSSRPLPKNPNSNKYKTRWKTELLTTANFWARSPLTARGSADYAIVYRVWTIPGGCFGFCPSTVVSQKMALGSNESWPISNPGGLDWIFGSDYGMCDQWWGRLVGQVWIQLHCYHHSESHQRPYSIFIHGLFGLPMGYIHVNTYII